MKNVAAAVLLCRWVYVWVASLPVVSVQSDSVRQWTTELSTKCLLRVQTQAWSTTWWKERIFRCRQGGRIDSVLSVRGCVLRWPIKQASATKYTGREPVLRITPPTVHSKLQHWACREQWKQWQKTTKCRQTIRCLRFTWKTVLLPQRWWLAVISSSHLYRVKFRYTLCGLHRLICTGWHYRYMMICLLYSNFYQCLTLYLIHLLGL